MIRIERANIIYRDSFIRAVKEVQDFDEASESTDWYKKLDVRYLENNFHEYIVSVLDKEKGINLKDGRVPSTMFWIIDENNDFVGRVSLRHYLNESLEKCGGHIGYDIIPSQRKKGYAFQALKFCLREAKRMGINTVLVTCDDDNIGSRKVIEKNGGTFIDKLPQDDSSYILRFNITNL
jgi:predicted acetyltransferase